MLNNPPNEKKRDVTDRLILAGFIVGAIVVIYLIFSVFPRILSHRSEKSGDKNEVAPKKIFHQVSLYIRSNVGGAEVHVKGVNYDEKKVTASTDKTANFFKLERGKYEVRVTKEGYQEVVKQIEITGDRSLERRQIDLTEVNP